MQHESTSTLPRGSIARDRNDDYLVIWPDGQYGYGLTHRHAPATIGASWSTGPYEVVLDGLTSRDCDVVAGMSTATRREVMVACSMFLDAASFLGGIVRRLAAMMRS